jgi:RHS repeat-associated protein
MNIITTTKNKIAMNFFVNACFLVVTVLFAHEAFGQPMWCANSVTEGTFTNIHNNGFDVCYIVPTVGTFNYKYEIRIGSESGSVVQTGYDTKSSSGSHYTQVTGLSPGTLYFVRAAYEGSPGVWTAWSDSRSVTTATGVYSLPALATSKDKNYIVSIAYTTKAQENATLPISKEERAVTVQYFDGMGRPLQEIAYKASPRGNDIVQPHVYDRFGHEATNYLPYVSSQDNAYYRPNPVGTSLYSGSSHQQFYANGLADKVIDDARPFSETKFEPSPLNRPLMNYGVGNAWAPAPGNKRIEYRYLTNVYGIAISSIQEKVIAWKVNSITGLPERESTVTGHIESGGYYSTGRLFVNETVDEQGHSVRQYTNKSGQLVLKKVQAAGDVSNLNSTTDWASTYYVYDDFGNVAFVFQPELTKLVHGNDSFVPSLQDLTNFAFQYKYDERGRMTEKRVPGSDWVYMVYDARDRLVLTQDGNQRSAKHWNFIKYDVLNRPVLTGITTADSVLTQSKMRTRVDSYFTQLGTNGGLWFEKYVGSVANNVHGYTNQSFPLVSNEQNYLTVTYYDNYNFKSTWMGNYNYVNESLIHLVNGVTYSQPASANLAIVSKITGTKIKVLDGNISGTISGGFTWLKSVNYYDDKYRVIQVIGDNYINGYDRLTNVYDFVGKVLKNKITHVKQGVTWKNVVGAKVEGNKLQRTVGGNTWGVSGASSQEVLPAGSSGWLEFTASESTTNRMIGLATSDPDQNYTSIAHAVYLAVSSYSMRIYESGTQVYGSGTFKTGDVFRIERSGTTVKYYKNNVAFYTSAANSTAPLLVDAALYTSGATLTNVKTSFSMSADSVIRTYDYDHAGRLVNLWHRYNNGTNYLLTKNEYNELGQLVDKKLHSTDVSGTTAKQSIDMRYNIRGWLTSINNSSLMNDAITNDEATDYFGMNLNYETVDASLGNKSMHNGNIGGIKWSNYGSGTVREKGYIFSYDAMDRLVGSFYREKGTAWADPSNNGFDERGFGYDLNGNITKLTRFDIALAGFMDSLVYSYGTGATQSNRLLRVTDYGDDYKGFVDGALSTDDYTYDANGNMTRDLNNGIGTSLTDATNIITYNFLNLPETITKGGNSVRYIYDASGEKLSQVALFGGNSKRTDYVGEHIYENNVLQFLNHEEGRIIVSGTKLIYEDHCDVTSTMVASNATLAPASLKGTEKYVKITASGTTARTGVFPIGGTLAVNAGERYKIRVKGYRTGTKDAYLLIKANNADVDWKATKLPSNVASESWVEQVVTIPTAAIILQVGVVWDVTVTGEIMYLNEVEITKLETQAPEYQYFLKDHLGNVRLTFTTKQETETSLATLEPANANAEQGKFLRYSNARVVNHYLFDKTNGGSPTTTSGGAQRLSGLGNEVYGLAKSISVMPGDIVSMEVYGKYIDSNSGNRTTALNTLISQIAGGTAPAGTVVDGGSYSSGTPSFPFAAGQNGTGSSSGLGPKAYLNWLVFDRKYNLIASKSNYARMTTAARETGQDVAHEKLSGSVTISEPGYVYIYLSNEEGPSPYEVYFDEFKVDHIMSPVIQMEDYYPFGLAFNSYSRENSIGQDYKYNGKEEQKELGLGWLDYGARMYQHEIGRFNTMDPAGEKFYPLSPYSYSANSPILLSDPTGRDWTITTRKNKDGSTTYVVSFKGAVLDSSDEKFDDEQMAEFADQITAGLNQFISGTRLVDEDGNPTGDNIEIGTIDVRVISNRDQLEKDDHLINIKDRKDKDFDAGYGQRAKGNAINGKEVSFSEAWFHEVRKGNYNSLIPHELGHTAGLMHPEEDNHLFGLISGETGNAPSSNFMRDTPTEPETGVTRAQIQRIYRLYQSGHLNKKDPHPIDQD